MTVFGLSKINVRRRVEDLNELGTCPRDGNRWKAAIKHQVQTSSLDSPFPCCGALSTKDNLLPSLSQLEIQALLVERR